MQYIKVLKDLMRKTGVTQAELARVIGRDRAVLTNMMQGKRKLTIEEAKKIAGYFDVDVSLLIGSELSSSTAKDGTMVEFQEMPDISNARLSKHIVTHNGAYYLQEKSSPREKLYAVQVKDNGLNLMGILKNDIAIYDMNAPIISGDIVVVQRCFGDFAATVVRKYKPPLLLPHSTFSEYTPLSESDADIHIVAPLVRITRVY